MMPQLLHAHDEGAHKASMRTLIVLRVKLVRNVAKNDDIGLNAFLGQKIPPAENIGLVHNLDFDLFIPNDRQSRLAQRSSP